MCLDKYPLRAPHVTIQSRLSHPNVFGNYICASILNTQEGYTPAYTLKSIAIQLLSFFISDSIEQEYGGKVDLSSYKTRYASPHNYGHSSDRHSKAFHCGACGFDARPITPDSSGVIRTPRRAWAQQPGRTGVEQQSRVIRGHRFVIADERRRLNDEGTGPSDASHTDTLTDSSDTTTPDLPTESCETSVGAVPTVIAEIPAFDTPAGSQETSCLDPLTEPLDVSVSEPNKVSTSEQGLTAEQPVISVDTAVCSSTIKHSRIFLTDLPNEILLTILSSLSFLDLTVMSSASTKAREIIDFYDIIRVRELQCFCLKEHFQDSKLGVGVDVGTLGKEKKLSSEFDLLSDRAFYQHEIRTSIHGLGFNHWLPLPISRRHFGMVEAQTLQSLDTLASAGKFMDTSHFSVLSHFLNDIVVSFSEEAERNNLRSTLAHASEKAVESYFAIFHLLLCLAADDPFMVRKANNKVFHFLSGKTSKTTCPNLGHLLVATLISDHRLSETLSVAIIKEAVLRNVVWMLDSKGANMPELSYLEPSEISEYRLKKTFEASRTSYRLLMFCHLFCRTARGLTADKTLAQSRDELFDTHGAPPRGIAQSMAQEIRRIKAIDSFPPFLKETGIQDHNLPGKAEFTGFLRNM
ncbi:MAG: hypothetical protein Q9226_004537, partial [Calogaya cf. arnoldii]